MTHHAELARAVADQVLVLSDGKVVADGHPDKVLATGTDGLTWLAESPDGAR